ncbi:beta-galactosidase [Mycolicibacterium farcinogenes]|uniref:beta-galactosidase n=1 Tax=Mycolicibacterium farcinogenes TaxID=1802 RepID=UPI001C8E81CC|nr:beta-galactosidase [Mycolicibacterium farcinogenes]QZH62692.1 beta-galactosidase [Mycolicibacterium farcinogenes]
MRRLNATRVGAILAVWALTAAGCTYSGQADVSSRRNGVIPYSEPDLVNPLRGQYQNLATELFPQASPAQREYQPWPGTTDVSLRLDWRTLQPRDPRKLPRDARDDVRYDFSVLDRALASAHANGRRVGFRVTAFNSCCETSYPKGIDISVPDWLLTIPGTTRTYPHGGVKYVIPDWNHPAYLSHFADLLAALGRRYDRDERLAMVEMSGYGDFSENHVAFMRDTLGRPAPSPERSQTELGYFSQYRDQYITKKAITFLVNANLRAFPNTALVTAAGNPRDHQATLPGQPAAARPAQTGEYPGRRARQVRPDPHLGGQRVLTLRPDSRPHHQRRPQPLPHRTDHHRVDPRPAAGRCHGLLPHRPA